MELAGSNVWLCVIVDQPAAPSTSKIGELNASPPKGRPVFAADGRTLMVAEWVTRAVFRFLAARESPGSPVPIRVIYGDSDVVVPQATR